MKKKDFVTLVLSTIGGLLFSLGMCMCLVSEWNAFKPGVVLGVIGAIVLIIMWVVRRKMEGKPAITPDRKTILTALLAIAGSLVLGVGMCIIMVWGKMVAGIIIGIVGILMLLCLIPVILGLKD